MRPTLLHPLSEKFAFGNLPVQLINAGCERVKPYLLGDTEGPGLQDRPI